MDKVKKNTVIEEKKADQIKSSRKRFRIGVFLLIIGLASIFIVLLGLGLHPIKPEEFTTLFQITLYLSAYIASLIAACLCVYLGVIIISEEIIKK